MKDLTLEEARDILAWTQHRLELTAHLARQYRHPDALYPERYSHDDLMTDLVEIMTKINVALL